MKAVLQLFYFVLLAGLLVFTAILFVSDKPVADTLTIVVYGLVSFALGIMTIKAFENQN